MIELIRSGDVIPYIRNVITPADEPLMPTVDYIWNEKHVDIMLKNKEDDETVRNKNIALFFKGIDVEGLGEKNVVKIIETGFDTIPKILQMTKEQLLSVDGFKEKMAIKVRDGIKEKIEKASLSKLMAVSNMFGRGFSDKKVDFNKIDSLLNNRTNDDFNLLKDEALKGNKINTNRLLADTVFEIENNIYYLNSINQRINRLNEIQNMKQENLNIDSIISNLKPPVFWKDKAMLLEQSKKWNKNKIQKALKKRFGRDMF